MLVDCIDYTNISILISGRDTTMKNMILRLAQVGLVKPCEAVCNVGHGLCKNQRRTPTRKFAKKIQSDLTGGGGEGERGRLSTWPNCWPLQFFTRIEGKAEVKNNLCTHFLFVIFEASWRKVPECHCVEWVSLWWNFGPRDFNFAQWHKFASLQHYSMYRLLVFSHSYTCVFAFWNAWKYTFKTTTIF